TVSTTGNFAFGIIANAGNGTLNDATISGNTVSQAGQHSVSIFVIAGGNLCVAEFSGNVSLNPGVFNVGSNDLNFNIAPGGTVDFVGFANVTVNNPGFDVFGGVPTGTPGACP
ncbi:MAG: hypothetical protein HC910_11120, partial [Spirulinaceae cyanobacterium SM2_1_0]|nr:hypothetical protein [Spirulinaceae cyanobacterium SM2_1_0]